MIRKGREGLTRLELCQIKTLRGVGTYWVRVGTEEDPIRVRPGDQLPTSP